MRILVTGGAGFIGSNLAKYLAAHGYDTVILDDFSSGDFRNLVKFSGDVYTDRCVNPPPGRFDVICHAASITDTTVTDQTKMMENNLERFRTVLSWAAIWKARVIWASSAAIYGNRPAPMREADTPSPLNVYGYSKLAMERLAARWHADSHLPIVALRYFNVYGPGEAHKGKFASMIYQLAQQMKTGKRPRIFHDGQQRRDFVWIDDVIQANIKALEVDGCHVLNVGSGVSESFNSVIAELNRVLHTKLQPEYIDNPYSFFQNHTEADIAQSRAILGYAPKMGLAEGILNYHGSGAL
jgi:ADP-L-glycero-D-manno-heptose 6-epimerase